MRTTLTLDDDIAAQLQKEERRTGASFKEVVNHFLRLGLTIGKRPPRKRFLVTPRDLHLPTGLNYDNVGELIDALEGTEHR